MILSFSSPAKFRTWLARHHLKSDGIWLRIFKKLSGQRSVSYAEALDEALCHGWIDGRKKALDDDSYLQWFCPRRKRSVWSKTNVKNVERLISEGRMKAAGLKKVEEAKRDGTWSRAYDSPSQSKIPRDFLTELKKDKKAEAFFKTLNKANLYAIAWRLQTAKRPETREKRKAVILDMLSRRKKFHE